MCITNEKNKLALNAFITKYKELVNTKYKKNWHFDQTERYLAPVFIKTPISQHAHILAKTKNFIVFAKCYVATNPTQSFITKMLSMAWLKPGQFSALFEKGKNLGPLPETVWNDIIKANEICGISIEHKLFINALIEAIINAAQKAKIDVARIPLQAIIYMGIAKANNHYVNFMGDLGLKQTKIINLLVKVVLFCTKLEYDVLSTSAILKEAYDRYGFGKQNQIQTLALLQRLKNLLPEKEVVRVYASRNIFVETLILNSSKRLSSACLSLEELVNNLIEILRMPIAVNEILLAELTNVLSGVQTKNKKANDEINLLEQLIIGQSPRKLEGLDFPISKRASSIFHTVSNLHGNTIVEKLACAQLLASGVAFDFAKEAIKVHRFWSLNQDFLNIVSKLYAKNWIDLEFFGYALIYMSYRKKADLSILPSGKRELMKSIFSEPFHVLLHARQMSIVFQGRFLAEYTIRYNNALFVVSPIKTEIELYFEGDILEHCVYRAHLLWAEKGKDKIYSIAKIVGGKRYKKATILLRNRTIIEARGKRNNALTKSELEVLRQWAFAKKIKCRNQNLFRDLPMAA